MLSLIPPVDDEGLRRHEIARREAGLVGRPRPVQPYPPADAAGSDRGRGGHVPKGPPTGCPERRRGERRRRQFAIVLDTRGRTDRRRDGRGIA